MFVRADRQPRPGGPAYPVTADWVVDVENALTHRGESQQWLAEQVGVEPATISHVLNRRYPTSRLVPAISRVLGISVPADALVPDDPALAHWLQIGAELQRLDRLEPALERWQKRLDHLRALAQLDEDDDEQDE